MIVMKFGGTSVGDAVNIRQVCQIVKGRLPRKPLVVTSAHSKVTDLLIAAANKAKEGKADISAVEKRQRDITTDLGLPLSLVDPLLAELAETIKGIAALGECNLRSMDLVMSYGERMAARVLAATFAEIGVKAEAIDAYDLGLRTDANFGAARPDEDSYPAVAKAVKKSKADVIITTGFIAKEPGGHITTLGRNGSDYSCTIFGAAVGAEEVEIWKDVNGVMTADPKAVKNAQSIPELTFNEAAELAWYGAKVLHPAAVLPATKAGIPVRVLNTTDPSNLGTVIVPHPTKAKDGKVAKSVVYKGHLTLITVISSRMLLAHGFVAKVFEVFAKHEVVINMISTSEITISITTDAPEARLKTAIKELSEYGKVEVKGGHALVCLVGEGMAGIPGVAAKAFTTLAEAKVNVQMISQGAREINISILVNDDDAKHATMALHKAFFE